MCCARATKPDIALHEREVSACLPGVACARKLDDFSDERVIGEAALVCRALDGDRGRALTVSTALSATLLTTAYGVTDEYHQSFVPGRTSDPMDVAKDLAGSAAASFLYRRWSMDAAAARGRPSPR